MPGMRTVLAALDGSPRAKAVLGEAVATARAHGARLVLVRAIGLPADVPQDFWKLTDKPLIDVLEEQARDYLARCEGDVPPETRGGSHVVIGSPWEAICRTAQTLAAELVVIGSHGYSGVDRLLGTTAAKVVNHSACSVLVVKEAAAAQPSESTRH
jgi:nucleotide-binding universal stress UspA family protein